MEENLRGRGDSGNRDLEGHDSKCSIPFEIGDKASQAFTLRRRMTPSFFPRVIGMVSGVYPNVAQFWKLANGI